MPRTKTTTFPELERFETFDRSTEAKQHAFREFVTQNSGAISNQRKLRAKRERENEVKAELRQILANTGDNLEEYLENLPKQNAEHKKILARHKVDKAKRQRAMERYAFVDELDPVKRKFTSDKRTMTAVEYKSKKWDNALRVTVNINPPTSDTSEVFAYIKDYLQRKYKTINGLTLNIEIGFTETMAKYRTGEFVVHNNSFGADFEEKTIQMLNRWQYDAQQYDGQELWGCSMFRLWIFQGQGGNFKAPIITGFSNRDLIPKLYIPMNKDSNDCSIICNLQFAASGLTDGGKVKLVEIKDQINEAAVVREKLYKHTNAVTLEELDKQAEYFEHNIKVYEIRNNKFECTYNYSEQEKTANLLLLNGHYSLVTNPALLEYVYCTVCRKWIRGIEAHAARCRFCRACHKAYVGEHTKADCTWNKNNQGIGSYEKKITALKVEKVFTANQNIIYADFETFKQADGSLVVYGIAWQLDDAQGIRVRGKNCMNQFMTWLMKLKKIKRSYTLVFYNGARFDLYFVNNWLQTHNVETKMLFVDGAYKRLEFCGITTFDLNMHLPGSLKDNCVAMGLEEDKHKGDFDHQKIKSWDDVEEHFAEWSVYLWQDIVSMKALYLAYVQGVWEQSSVNANQFMSSPSKSFKVFRTTLEKPIDLPTVEEDEFYRRAIYGGRCYPQKQYFLSAGGRDVLKDLDIVSMYPAAMALDARTNEKFAELKDLGWFPTCSEVRHVTEENPKQLTYIMEKLNLKQSVGCRFGVECDITPNTKLVSAVIPRRDERGLLVWDLKPIKRNVYTMCDLQRAIKKGYVITHVYEARLFWNDKGSRIFDKYIHSLFKLKAAAKGVNKAAYTMAKNGLSELYGKMIQKPIYTKNEMCSDVAELNAIRAKGHVLGYSVVGDWDKLYVSYTPSDTEKLITKPSYIGAYILSYSRMLMDFYIDKFDGYTNLEKSFFYTDTDSLILHQDSADKLSPYFGVGLGELGFDIDGDITEYACVGPKVYNCTYEKDGVVKTHVRAKGFSMAEQKQLTMNDFRYMLGFASSVDNHMDLEDQYGNEKGTIDKKDGTIVLHLNDKLKKIGFNLNSKQEMYQPSSIVSQKFERTLNKTKFMKRVAVVGDACMSSYPIGYSLP
jgi:uncharacterized protein YprB with RNaseH-like and TPR domain